jgi:hypothetical protein
MLFSLPFQGNLQGKLYLVAERIRQRRRQAGSCLFIWKLDHQFPGVPDDEAAIRFNRRDKKR